MANSVPDDILSWENFIYLADLFEKSGERKFPLLGGEPSLHPDFNKIIHYLLTRGFDVTVFTSGVMSDQTLEEAVSLFRNYSPNRLSFVCNLNDPGKTRSPLSELESVKRFLSAFNDRVVPGFNIYRADFDLNFLFEYINKYGLHRNIRMGLTHPIVGKKNNFIQVDDIEDIINRLFAYAPEFERLRIKPGLDCGFPLCKFTDEQLAWMYKNMGEKYDFGCGPVVDIGPDMNVWSCFPLSSLNKRSVFEFDTLQEVYDYYWDIHNKIKIEAGGIYLQCDDCNYRDEGSCAGGCLAHTLNNFQSEVHVRVEEVYQ